ncbi:hypothetical protein RHGRI_037244 [Rhododendron griersonianum]|uniref:Ankyrin repeat domain-containing protein n=1 Tax=Rhododendron griersonianum TaxID=479676 RepID=A0AAV6HRM9_9ERIC|nr:hypothetical protein RHGRI_037244 [Rhododendron griersonianum]
MSKSSPSTTTIKPEDFRNSPVHYAVATGDHTALSRIVSALPRLADPSKIRTESDSLTQERIADKISLALDRRDNPHRETPLHLAVRLNDSVAASTLAGAGADISLQNSSGWNPLQESICRRFTEVSTVLLQHQHRAAWWKWRRRLPRLISVLHRMRDFYMEMSFHFESSIVPFVGKIAPSDTYRIWKVDGNLRADTSLSGFDGMKALRADQSFLFLGDGDQTLDLPSGSLIVLNHDNRKIYDAFENAGNSLGENDVASFCAQTSVYRPGMDVTQAELLDEDDDGFLVAENPQFSVVSDNQRRRHSSFVRDDRDVVLVSRKSVDVVPSMMVPERRRPPCAVAVVPPQTKEKEMVKNLRPLVWLTEQFPLKTEELLPLLDILANKVKAVRRMRDLLTTKFPTGTFPVKVRGILGALLGHWRQGVCEEALVGPGMVGDVSWKDRMGHCFDPTVAIPVMPTVRVVITFTKFVELQPTEQFYTPFSSPRHLVCDGPSTRGEEESETHYSSFPSTSSASTSSTALPRRSTSRLSSAGKFLKQPPPPPPTAVQQSDPFAIPSGYSLSSFDEKSRKMKKSKSIRKTR